MPKQETYIMPFQPYVLLQAKQYKQLVKPHMGISHFYEFSMEECQSHAIDAVPDGSVDLLFNIGERRVETYISGTVFHVKSWQMGERNTCFGVRFQPGQGILPKEINRSMLVDQDILIDGNVFGENLVEKIAEAKDMTERVQIFENAYQSIVQKNEDTGIKQNIERYVRKRIYETEGTISIQQISEETNYSLCYIRRIFKEYHGVSPKQFAQFIRFQHLLDVLKQDATGNGMVAQNCGYYDEAHMMKEFKTNTGVTMEQYRKMMAPHYAQNERRKPYETFIKN